MNEDERQSFIGKTILVGITYLDPNEEVIDRYQCSGVIMRINDEEGIMILPDGETEEFTLPPEPTSIQEAEPGTYRIRSTGQVVVDPDYLTTWTVRSPMPN